jgi:transcriptional repressor NrdR
MRCPFCKHEDTQVRDSRSSEDGMTIRRRRVCSECNGRFTTFERIQIRDLFVIKKDGQRKAFDRDKLIRSLNLALRKRHSDPDFIEKIANEIIARLEATGESEIDSSLIGEMVMSKLSQIDQVAYVRFASVYRDFKETGDFQKFVTDLAQKNDS